MCPLGPQAAAELDCKRRGRRSGRWGPAWRAGTHSQLISSSGSLVSNELRESGDLIDFSTFRYWVLSLPRRELAEALEKGTLTQSDECMFSLSETQLFSFLQTRLPVTINFGFHLSLSHAGGGVSLPSTNSLVTLGQPRAFSVTWKQAWKADGLLPLQGRYVAVLPKQ